MVATQESLESKSERCEISLLAVLFVAVTGCSIAVGGIYLLVLMVVATSALLGVTLLAEAIYVRLNRFGP